jgi:hypothetical protein
VRLHPNTGGNDGGPNIGGKLGGNEGGKLGGNEGGNEGGKLGGNEGGKDGGGATGVALLDAADSKEVPLAFVAFTLKV